MKNLKEGMVVRDVITNRLGRVSRVYRDHCNVLYKYDPTNPKQDRAFVVKPEDLESKTWEVVDEPLDGDFKEISIGDRVGTTEPGFKGIIFGEVVKISKRKVTISIEGRSGWNAHTCKFFHHVLVLGKSDN